MSQDDFLRIHAKEINAAIVATAAVDSLEMLELIMVAEQNCKDAFPHLARELDLSEIQPETWKAALPELENLFPLHWQEIALFQGEMPMDLDSDHYQRIEDMGRLLLLTARVDKKLIGYYLGYFMTHPHYKSSGQWAVTDMYFIRPEYRDGAGLKLFVAFEKIARGLGCVHAVTSCKVHQDHKELLEKLGWQWTDRTFQKHLL